MSGGFQPCRQIYPIAVDLVAIRQHLAEIDPDPDLGFAVVLYILILLGEFGLNHYGCFHR